MQPDQQASQTSPPKQRPKREKVKPVGSSLRWSKEAIARLSLVDEEDVSAARAHWRRLAPRRFKNLLEAKKRKR
jgi:hypothetical protein